MSTNKEGILFPTNLNFDLFSSTLLLNLLVITISHNIFQWQRQRKSTTANRDTMLTFPPATTHLRSTLEGYGIEHCHQFSNPPFEVSDLQVKRHTSAYKSFFLLNLVTLNVTMIFISLQLIYLRSAASCTIGVVGTVGLECHALPGLPSFLDQLTWT